jgi:lipopolysaccharide/colanic/teichoic acid biosynthesis glycosyltransferase
MDDHSVAPPTWSHGMDIILECDQVFDTVEINRALGQWQQIQKGVFDRLVGIWLLILISPVLIVVGLIIKMNSRGPALFRQIRLGIDNQPFVIYKFRTMHHHDDRGSLDGSQQARRADPRITDIGRWLRKYSVDELPQLLNVMKGNMSLVGPRPHPLNMRVAGQPLHDLVPDYADRHRVLPGITGWAQVNGCRGETIAEEQLRERVAHDLHYIAHWSLIFDIHILFLTVVREIFSGTAF